MQLQRGGSPKDDAQRGQRPAQVLPFPELFAELGPDDQRENCAADLAL
jgi:hypothetical protein